MTPLRTLDLDLLRAFVTVIDEGGFTRAGAALGRTQSAISLQIQRLEQAVGRPLLKRGGRALAATPDGQVLLGYARQMLKLNDEARSSLIEPEVEGTVRLGTPEDFATRHLPQVLAPFARAHPRVSLDVRLDLTLNLVKGFERGDYDIVLVKREPEVPRDGIKVWREPLEWVAGAYSPGSPDETLSLVLSPEPCVYRRRALTALDTERRRWRIAYTCPSLAGTQAAVQAGLGVTVLPREMLTAGLRAIGRREGLPELEDTEIALLRARRLSKAGERLVEHIVESLEAERRSAGNG